MQPNKCDNKPKTLISLDVTKIINVPEFQQGYRDGYTHQSQQSEDTHYLAGYLHGSKDRVLYRDC